MQLEYWDLELKDQSKNRMDLVNSAITKFGATVHSRYSDNLFSGSQQWRNPLLMRISLEKGKKYDFILASKLSCWLHKPDQVSVGEGFESIPSKLKGNHGELQFKPVRNYRLNPPDRAYIKDVRTGKIITGSEKANRILNGELDLIIE